MDEDAKLSLLSSSALTGKWLPIHWRCSQIVGLIQFEVADRVAAETSTKK